MTIRLRRSILYVPGSNNRAIEKARALDADAVILDLEDAVAPEEKDRARAQVRAAVSGRAFGSRAVVVRINHPSTEWGRDDLLSVAAAAPDAVLVPKVGMPADIMAVAGALSHAGAPDATRVWIMIETPAAIANIMALAGTAADPSARLEAFVMGTNDLALETRIRVGPGRAALLSWLSACVAAARCHDLDAFDGVFNGLDDPTGLRDECEQGREFGFDGKTLIHPNQIAACNAAFAPTRDEIGWAQAVLAAFANPANADKGALRVEGRMVERLHAVSAARIMATTAAIADRNQAGPEHVALGSLTAPDIAR